MSISSLVRISKTTFDDETNPRILSIAYDYSSRVKTVAVSLHYLIDAGGLSEQIQILNVKNLSLLTFRKFFQEICDKEKCSHVCLDETFPIQAENGNIVINNGHLSSRYMVGKPIPD